MRLQGKVALVTGASRGIGRAIAERFAEEGADVVVNYARSAASAEEVKKVIEQAGRRAALIQADVGTVEGTRQLVAESIRQLGRLDILVYNAGIESSCPFWEVTEADYDLVLNVNLKGPFFATQTFVRHLLETRRPGKVINVSSVHEELPFPNFASYCAAKGGLKMLTRNLGVELGRFGITVNAIAPGAIQTDINAQLLQNQAKVSALLGQIPLGRIGQPADVAALAVFLASADSDYVTGTTYFVDGGLTWSYEE